METTMKRLRPYVMVLLVMASVLVGLCQVPKTGFSAQATALNFYFNDDPSVYTYTGQTRAVSATVQISIVLEGTFNPGVHTHPSWTVSITGPDPNNPQQTTTVGTATFTHSGPYTNANVSVTLPAAAGAYTYTASLTGGEGTATPVSDSARIVEVASLQYKIGDGDFTAMPGTLYVAKGTAVTFKAIPNPVGVWPSGKPVWGGNTGATGTGETKEVTFVTVSTSLSDLKTVTVECGNTVTINVVVFSLALSADKTAVVAGGIDSDAHSCTLAVTVTPAGVEGDVTFSYTAPDGVPTPDGLFDGNAWFTPSGVTKTVSLSPTGYASAHLISSNRISPEVIGKVAYVGVGQCEATVLLSFNKPTAEWIEIPLVYCDDNPANVIARLQNDNGEAMESVDQHYLQWRIQTVSFDPERTILVYDADNSENNLFDDLTDEYPENGIPDWVDWLFGAVIANDLAPVTGYPELVTVSDTNGETNGLLIPGAFPGYFFVVFPDYTIYR